MRCRRKHHKEQIQTQPVSGHSRVYKGFLTLWKEADPDIPILKQAKGEYAKLQ
jgi:hypothetical protein